ncbi:di-N-acetylchitobiase-like [Rhinoraja longicauda]
MRGVRTRSRRMQFLHRKDVLTVASVDDPIHFDQPPRYQHLTYPVPLKIPRPLFLPLLGDPSLKSGRHFLIYQVIIGALTLMLLVAVAVIIIRECHYRGAQVIVEATFRQRRAVRRWFEKSKTLFLDGIILGFDRAVSTDGEKYNKISVLMQDVIKVFHEEIPGSLKFKTCLFSFIQKGIDPRKIVMGVSWSGYDFTCNHFREVNFCELGQHSGTKAVCSIQSANAVTYEKVMQHLSKSITGRLWDDHWRNPYFAYLDGKTYHEIWYDDPESISLKSTLLKKLKLRGIGMWAANDLNYSRNAWTLMQTEAMWNALCPP